MMMSWVVVLDISSVGKTANAPEMRETGPEPSWVRPRAYKVDRSSHSPITYPRAMVRPSPDKLHYLEVRRMLSVSRRLPGSSLSLRPPGRVLVVAHIRCSSHARAQLSILGG